MSKDIAGEKKRVILVDDHPLLRRGLAQLINQERDMMICGEAEDAATGLAMIQAMKPDVAVTDITLPDKNGIDLVKDILIRAPGTLVLVLSMHDEAVYAERVLKAGARGYVSKGESPTRVIEGIRRLVEGKIFISDKLSGRILQKFAGGGGGAKEFTVDNLSDREFEILGLIGSGMQATEIAEKLHLSVKTIDAHRENMKRKLRCVDAAELRKYAIRWAQTQQGM
jgi:DNA-binding NarL/FixJ family response regulator